MPLQMSTEKFMRAERKNRLETHRLKVTCKHYDKATTRLNYEIDREKRHITKAFRSVIKTSGASDLGIPPKDENDTDFEKCPSYMQGLKLSNKRLQEWRECEKQLDKFIMQHEMERAKQQRKKYIKKSTSSYDIIPARRTDELDDDVFLEENESVVTNDKFSPIDLLKDNPDDSNEVFDIKKWEADIIQSYKTMVCTDVNITKKDLTKGNLKSFSSPTFSSTYDDYNKQKHRRPHTAQPRVRPRSAKTNGKLRPASANVNNTCESKFLITKDSIYIRTGQSFEKLLENRPVNTPLMVNNYITNNSLKPVNSVVEKEPSIASMSTLCPVQEGDEDVDEETSKHSPDHDNTEQHEVNGEEEHEVSEAQKPSQLSLKFQRRLRSKLEKTRLSSGKHSFKHSNSDLSSYVESGRRTRRDSESASSMMSIPMSRTGSIVSSHRPSVSLGISADIEEISRGQNKLLSEIKPEKPLSTNKLVSVGKIVRAALTFSRVARKRALLKMQEENSSDSHELVRQERLRRLQSRQNVLNTIASQWETDPNTNIEQVE